MSRFPQTGAFAIIVFVVAVVAAYVVDFAGPGGIDRMSSWSAWYLPWEAILLFVLTVSLGGLFVGMPTLIVLRSERLAHRFLPLIVAGTVSGLFAGLLMFAWWAAPDGLGLLLLAATVSGGLAAALWYALVERFRIKKNG